METPVPTEQPQRVKKVWSHTVIGNVTLLAMLAPVVLGFLFNVGPSTSEALALGAFAGFVLAAINWFRLGRRWKGLFHLLISPVIYLIIPVGVPLLLAGIVYVLSAGSAERATEISQGITSVLVFALYFGVAFLVIAYLYTMTKRDIAQLQAKGIPVEYADFLLPMGIAVLSVMLMWEITTVAGQAYVASKQNHVYCELLQPGMTEEEVSRALMEIGAHYQASGAYKTRLPERGVANLRTIHWKDSDIDWNYDLWLWIGYDEQDKLVWIARDTQDGLKTIECPWTFSQSVTAR
jgi:hypothetical protein